VRPSPCLIAGGVAKVQFHLLDPGTSIASWIATEFGELKVTRSRADGARSALDAAELQFVARQSLAR